MTVQQGSGQPGEPLSNMADHWWWRPGWSVGRRFYTWHLTFADAAEVRRLAARYRAALADVPDLVLVPDRWLHLTMQGIGFVDEVDRGTVDRIVEAARVRLGRLPAFDITLGPAVLYPEAVLLAAQPAEPVGTVRTAIRNAIRDVLPEVPESADGFRPHVSVAYSAGTGAAGPVADALARLGDATASTRVVSAELIVLGRDQRMYEWDTYRSLPLAS
ncbi:2'-5' RNA ligase family protein [Streptomyces sp. NPDC049954]|uniref:2'-5' RNA ligase family protein n=1 Tax=Streptomyces sp. NPDC049954 TaxID=3155779 RepID=UPI00341B280E